MIKKLIILISIFSVIGCTSKYDAEEALKAIGFTNIEYTGYKLFACDESDFYHTGFIATNHQGLRVSGTVCSGLLFKNSTVRFS